MISGRIFVEISGRIFVKISGRKFAQISGRIFAQISGHIFVLISGRKKGTNLLYLILDTVERKYYIVSNYHIYIILNTY